MVLLLLLLNIHWPPVSVSRHAFMLVRRNLLLLAALEPPPLQVPELPALEKPSPMSSKEIIWTTQNACLGSWWGQLMLPRQCWYLGQRNTNNF